MTKKRVLITLPKINRLGGATVLTHELAKYFMDTGYDVFIYTTLCDPPASKYFKKHSINVITCTDKFPYHLKDFSLIFINSQIFPTQLVEDFGKKQPKYPKIFFLHKSAFDYISDEQPWIFEFEEKIADASLFISEETLEKNRPFFTAKHPQEFLFFRNPAPSIPNKLFNYKPSKELSKILIVSNHTPTELRKASELLRKQNIIVDGLGDGNLTGIISYDVISEYDLIITIGKTVQYCLVLGQPVYIYDHFGGCGFLNKKNLNLVKEKNFSGREKNKNKKTSDQIVNEILTQYNTASSFITKNRLMFQKEFLIDNVIPDIIKTKTTQKPIFSKAYINSIQSAQRLANSYFGVAAERDMLQDKNTELSKQNDKLNQDINNICNSKSWKIGNKIIRPISNLKKLFNR